MRYILPLLVLLILTASGLAQPADLTGLDDPYARFTPDAAAVYAQADEHMSSRLALSHSAVTPGGELTVAVEIELDETYWLYSATPSGRAAAGDVDATVPKPLGVTVEAEDLEVTAVLLPAPTVHPSGEGVFYDEHYVYEGREVLLVTLSAPADAQPGSRLVVVTLTGQVCTAGQCLEMLQTPSAEVAVAAQAVANPAFAQPPAPLLSAEAWRERLPAIPASDAPARAPGPSAEGVRVLNAIEGDLSVAAYLALAVVAGLILNIMPCVLPVIPLKILSIVDQAGQNRRRGVTLGLAYAGGIWSFFILLAIVSFALRASLGRLLALNEMLAYPPVVIALSLIFTAMALNLFGLFTVSFGGSLASGERRSGHLGSVSMGFITAVLATPCSFAIIASVLAWAQTQPALLGALVMVLIGFGMALPHVLLTSFPKLLEKLPAPGVWMEHFKHAMGFVLLGVAVYVLLFLQDGAWIVRVALYAVIFGLCIWAAGTWVNFNTPAPRKWAVRIVALLVAVAAGWLLLGGPKDSVIDWREYDPAAVERLAGSDRPVLIKFTASWCTECKILDYRVFNRPATAEAFERHNVAAFVGDVTRTGMPARDLLYGQFNQSPPFTVIYPAGGGEPIALAGDFEPEQLYEALDAAAGGG